MQGWKNAKQGVIRVEELVQLGNSDELMIPRRVQLKRTKGWRLPPNTVKVDRTTPYGNPFKVAPALSRERAISQFRAYLAERLATEPGFLQALRGKNLACWCKIGESCHADILLKAANRKKW